MIRRRVIGLPSENSDDESSSKKTNSQDKKCNLSENEDSSSDSDIGNYLQPIDKIDFNSSFFNLQNDHLSSFNKIENNIFAGVNRLCDSDSDSDSVNNESLPDQTASILNFQQLHEYTKKIEEVKKHAEEYEAKKRTEDKQVDIFNLLAAGESRKCPSDAVFYSCDSENEGWEDVADKEEEQKSLVPREGVQITVEIPGAIKKKGDDLMASIKRRLNRVRKENQVLVHKVHLLCWIAHGNYVSSVINSQNVLALALSLLPSEKCYPANRTDLKYLEQIVTWYRNVIIINDKVVPKNQSLEKLLQSQITKKGVYNRKMFVYVFVAILRSLGIQCRLVLSFQIEPLRPPSSELCSFSMKSEKAGTSRSKFKNNATPVSTEQKLKSQTTDNDKSTLKVVSGNTQSFSQVQNNRKTKSNKQQQAHTVEEPKKSVSKSKPYKRKSDNNSEVAKGKSKKKMIPQVDGANDSESNTKPNLKKLKFQTNSCPLKHPKRLKPKITKVKDTDSEDDDHIKTPFSNETCTQTKRSVNLNNFKASPHNKGVNLKKLKDIPSKSTKTQSSQSKFFEKKPLNIRNDIISLVKQNIKKQKQIERSKMVKSKRNIQESDENSDYAPDPIKKKRRDSDDDLKSAVTVKRRIPANPTEEPKKKIGVDVWAEVFLETEEKWLSVDVVKGQVHCINELYTRATHPVSYIVAWNNNNTLKDITRRYCQNFNTITRKLRIDSTWWETTLKPFLAPKTAREREEDEELEKQQFDKPLPTSIAEYKNHPLYVLKRHLLKFQAIYPPEVPPLGFIKNEPVYYRHCVYTLHSRDVWLKHAKIVKEGESPYKIVKARTRYDKLSNSRITDQTVEIFGSWQTKDYVPPVAENGVVPRNAFGNVELFKPCMLPKNTIHLQLPGLNKVARKLEIDCAPAVVGFDFHSGGSHPTFDGFVVCEEYADVLIAAWEQDRDELAKKEKEKIEKRVYGNWRKLIRGLLIRERLKAKYEFGESSNAGKKKSHSG